MKGDKPDWRTEPRLKLPEGWTVSVRTAKGADITNFYAFLYEPGGKSHVISPPSSVYWLSRGEAKHEAVKEAVRLAAKAKPDDSAEPPVSPPSVPLCKCGHRRDQHYRTAGRCHGYRVLFGGGHQDCACSRYHAVNKAIPLSPSLKLATGKLTRPGTNSEGRRWLRAAAVNKAERKRELVAVATEEQAMEYLRRACPGFFGDPPTRAVAAVVVARIPDALAKLKPVERSGVIAAIMALMYDMGGAAVDSVRRFKEKDVNMTSVFLERARAKAAKGKEDDR